MKRKSEPEVNRILQTYGDTLYRTTYLLLGNPHDVQDVLQEFLPAPEKQHFMQELYALPAKWKVVLLLYYFEGYTVKEIAKIIGLTENAVKKRLQRAREALKKEVIL